MKLTRRKLAAAVLGSAAAMPQATPAALDEDLEKARGRVRAISEALAKEEVPMSTEPAFQFKA